MKLFISFENELIEFNLYDFQYWNQRFFCLGMSTDGRLMKKFISTKGFDKLLVESDIGSKFNFKKEHFNPYLCDKEKDIWKESDQVEKHKEKFETSDVGPHNFSGHYVKCADLDNYKDQYYFETKKFDIYDFDLYKYRNDDLYFTQHQSSNKDKLPNVVNLFDANLFGKLNIIHCVGDNGNEYVDFASLYQICDADLGYPTINSFYSILS